MPKSVFACAVALRADWSMLVAGTSERKAAFSRRSSTSTDACVCVSGTVSSASAHSMKYLQDTQPQENNRMDKGINGKYIDRRSIYVFAVSFKCDEEIHLT